MTSETELQSEIKSAKILVKDIFSTMWFRIPEYQRPYRADCISAVFRCRSSEESSVEIAGRKRNV
jgi:hypothetical protein